MPASVFWIVEIVLLGLAALSAAPVVRGLRRRRLLRATLRLPLPLLFLSLALLLGSVKVALVGYERLTHEVTAATVELRALGPQRFRADVTLPSGEKRSFELAGDRLYLDAHVVKWHPLLNVIGVHTAYRLARIGGRYDSVQDERARPRTVHALSEEPAIDVFSLAEKMPTAFPLVDAAYGSASFVPATDRARYQLRVSTSGLLFREVQ